MSIAISVHGISSAKIDEYDYFTTVTIKTDNTFGTEDDYGGICLFLTTENHRGHAVIIAAAINAAIPQKPEPAPVTAPEESDEVVF